MEAKLTFKYDREADILYLNKRAPYPEPESEELGDEVIARLNPTTGEVRTSRYCFSQPGCYAMTCSCFRGAPICGWQ